MTVEERVTKLEDQMIVQAELMVRLEKRVDLFAERVEAWIDTAENRMAKLEVLSAAVLERMDRFIAGQEGNGKYS
jgi:hypothetical protein